MTYDSDEPATANSIRDLMDRIGQYLDDAGKDPSQSGQTFHPHHPTTLLAQAEQALEELALMAGLWGPPRTVQLGARESVQDIAKLSAELVDQIGTDPSVSRVEKLAYATGVLTALARYHGKWGPPRVIVGGKA